MDKSVLGKQKPEDRIGSGDMFLDGDSGRIEAFVDDQVLGRGLDQRTAMAYRTDLEQLHLWLEEYGRGIIPDEKAVEAYLAYLTGEKLFKYSTVTRKYRVFCYYIDYLAGLGLLKRSRPIVLPEPVREESEKEDRVLSRAEVDSFFAAFDQEYEKLDSEFRRRICLRDSVMMGILFYHEIEVSELLRLEVADYDRRSGMLTIRGKRGKRRTEYLFARELKERLERWIGERDCFVRKDSSGNILFLSRAGKALGMKTVVLIFEKYRELAGIEKGATPKDLKGGMKQYAKELLMERCG